MSGILVYVGVEVSMGTTALSYLHDPSLGGFSLAQATSFIALYWGGALAGRFCMACWLTVADLSCCFACVLRERYY